MVWLQKSILSLFKAAKTVVRVHFMDDSCRAFAIEENQTAEQLKAVIVEKIEMKEDACFAIFEKKDGWGKMHVVACNCNFNKERCLEPDEKPCELMTLWTDPSNSTNPGEKKVSKPREGPAKESFKDASFAFIFKKKIFLRDDEREMADPVAKHHVYIQVSVELSVMTHLVHHQACYSVIESEYPCTADDAIRLAGLQVQIVYGNHKTDTHIVGFLT
jgi:hypothetical protein